MFATPDICPGREQDAGAALPVARTRAAVMAHTLGPLGQRTDDELPKRDALHGSSRLRRSMGVLGNVVVDDRHRARTYEVDE